MAADILVSCAPGPAAEDSEAQAQELLSQVMRLLQPDRPPLKPQRRSLEVVQPDPEPRKNSFEFRSDLRTGLMVFRDDSCLHCALTGHAPWLL